MRAGQGSYRGVTVGEGMGAANTNVRAPHKLSRGSAWPQGAHFRPVARGVHFFSRLGHTSHVTLQVTVDVTPNGRGDAVTMVDPRSVQGEGSEKGFVMHARICGAEASRWDRCEEMKGETGGAR